VTTALVHFLNIMASRPACPAVAEGECAVSSLDPAKVSCPECLRYLKHEQAPCDVDHAARGPWDAKGES
jgi:hypothetical protein